MTCYDVASTRNVGLALPSVSARMCRNIARMLWSASAAAADAFAAPMPPSPPPASATTAPGGGGGFPRSSCPVSTAHAASSPLSGHPGCSGAS